MLELGFAAFLLAHGGVHASFLAPRPPAKEGAPAWPFDTSHSWLLSPLGVSSELLRAIGIALTALTLGGFALAALGVVGLLPVEVTVAATIVGSVASLALLATFFHPWLVIGVFIDIVLVWLAMMRG